MSVSSKFALVTGTSSGIGLATAARLLDRGWDVVGISRRNAPIAIDSYRHMQLDLANMSAVATELESRVAPLLRDPARSRVALINNAASAALLGTMESLDATQLAHVYTVNVAPPTATPRTTISPVEYSGSCERCFAGRTSS